MKKQIALIGVTGFGASHLFHLHNLAEAGLVDIAAAVVINPEQAAESLAILKTHNTRIYPDANAFFAAEAGRIDLVCLPVGIAAHESLTLTALEHGMNVLVEKPASGSAESVKRMIAAEKKSGKFVAVGYQNGYAPEIHFIKRLLFSGRLGGICYSTGIVCWPRDDAYYQRNAWAAKRSVNGIMVLDSPLNNACAHYINLLLFLNGSGFDRCAAAVNVSGEVLRARPEIEMFDACDANYTLDNGKNCRIMLAHCCTERVNPIIKIVCERGTVIWHGNAAWSVTDNDNTVIASGTAVHPGETMFRTVLSRLDDPAQTVYTLENSLAQTQAVELLDKTLPITPAEARYENGIYVVDGLVQKYKTAFGGEI